MSETPNAESGAAFEVARRLLMGETPVWSLRRWRRYEWVHQGSNSHQVEAWDDMTPAEVDFVSRILRAPNDGSEPPR